jgi:hypothetical protein
MRLPRMLAAAFFLVAVLATASLVIACPSTVLVMDSRGNLYFSDLTNVWVLRPDGTTAIAVPRVHTHELWLGPADTLYGEDVTNVGEAYRHRVWKLAPNGELSDQIPWREGFPDDFHDYGFNRDSAGLTYALRRSERVVEVLDEAEGLVRTVSLAGLEGFVHWSPVGGLVSDDGALWILEWSGSNQARVRRLHADGTESLFAPD